MKNATVLFVDDSPVTLVALKKDFLGEPYEKLFASSSSEAFGIFEKKQIHVIVADLEMPVMSGQELLNIVMKKYPNTVRIVLSAQTDINAILKVANEGRILKFISKPWKLEEEFKPAIREAIEYYGKKMDRKAKQVAST